jgi:histidine triad (HIT) family protein
LNPKPNLPNPPESVSQQAADDCPFCSIVYDHAPVSTVYEDETILALIPLHPVYPGACMVIPKAHIDPFTEIPDDIAARIMIVAQHIGRKIMEVYHPLRVGMAIHGFNVAHAHLHVFPQYDELDIMFKHDAHVKDGEVSFEPKDIPPPDRETLDQMAASIRIDTIVSLNS